MGLQEKINANPTVYAVAAPARKKFDVDEALDEDAADSFEPDEVFGGCKAKHLFNEEAEKCLTKCCLILIIFIQKSFDTSTTRSIR